MIMIWNAFRWIHRFVTSQIKIAIFLPYLSYFHSSWRIFWIFSCKNGYCIVIWINWIQSGSKNLGTKNSKKLKKIAKPKKCSTFFWTLLIVKSTEKLYENPVNTTEVLAIYWKESCCNSWYTAVTLLATLEVIKPFVAAFSNIVADMDPLQDPKWL